MARPTDREVSTSFIDKLQAYQYSEVVAPVVPKTGMKSSPNVMTRQTRARKDVSRTPTPAVPDPSAKITKLKPTGKKAQKPSSKYAPPSKYAHLQGLTDILEPNLLLVFVGFNPGVQTATSGHAYAHPSNLFWKLLHRSGLTDRQLRPDEDGDLPRLYAMGNTNLVSRPSRDTAELSREEQVASVPLLEAKIRKFRPEAVCIVGKSIWENIWRYRYGVKPRKSEYKTGWQDERENMGKTLPSGDAAGKEDDEDVQGEEDVDDADWPGARVFVATSTSGLDASLRPAEKEAIWRPLGEWAQMRRRERAEQPQIAI